MAVLDIPLDEWREHLDELPEHMHKAIVWWLDKGEPHPSAMGSFFLAVLLNDFVGAVAAADHINTVCLGAWAEFLFAWAPPGSWGSEKTLLAWHARHHPEKVPEP